MTEPASADLFGPQTARARDVAQLPGRPFPLAIIHAVARIKAAAAGVLTDLVPDRLPPEIADAIATAAGEVVDGRWNDQFVLGVFQTGSGTSTHMNVNEVLATRATQLLGGIPVHPNDHVNLGQSSNDVMPTAMRLASIEAAVALGQALARLERELGLQERKLKHVVKAGRTHLQDAVPVTLGQEFGGYRQQIADARARIEGTLPDLGSLPLGGTAVGNGVNAPVGYAARTIEVLAARTGADLRPAPDRFAVQGAHDAVVDLSGRVRAAAVSLQKIANDIRLMGSGPATGFGEIELATLQPGSSIMPGKVNPVAVEIVNQVVARVIGNDATIAFAGAQGILELNTHVPVMAAAMLDSLELMTAATDLFAARCVASLQPDIARARSLAEQSTALVTALTPLLGYDGAAAALATARSSGRPLVDVVVDDHGLDREQVESRLDLLAMAQGSVEPTTPDLPFEDPHVPADLVSPDDSGTI